jgi:hypothetical protein
MLLPGQMADVMTAVAELQMAGDCAGGLCQSARIAAHAPIIEQSPEFCNGSGVQASGGAAANELVAGQ